MTENTRIQTYTPTFLEKLLGPNYKWWYMTIYNFKAQRAYFADTLMWTAYGLFSLLGGFFIWWLTTKDNQNFDTAQILTYLFVGNLLSNFINNWAQTDMGWMNKGGTITSQLLVPTSFVKIMYVRYIGRNMLANFPISLLGVLICLPLIKNYFLFPASIWSVFLIILLLPISYTIGFFMNFSFGCITFWMTETEGANNFYGYFRSLLSGYIVPLTLLLAFIPFLDFLPFAWLLHHPMQIYLGKYSPEQTLVIFATNMSP